MARRYRFKPGTKFGTGSQKFFYEHAGWARSKGQSERQARMINAAKLANAEEWAKEYGYSFAWEEDPLTNREFTEEGPEYHLWAVLMRGPDGKVAQSLGGVDFGHDGENGLEPWGAPYRRVVEAELALEEMNK